MSSKRETTSADSARIGVLFLILGALSLTYSIIQETQILAFVGLGLTFWGFLFITIAPSKPVEGILLEGTALPNYETADRLLKNFPHKHIAYHIMPSPEENPPPVHKSLGVVVVSITNANEKVVPDTKELTDGRFMMHNPSSLVISPPGIGLLATLENKTKTDFTKMNMTELCETLPRLILDNYSLADEIEMTMKDQSTIKLKLINSIYKNLYSREYNLQSISLLGCPLVSAMACALTKSTGKPVAIHEQEAHELRLDATLKIKQD